MSFGKSSGFVTPELTQEQKDMIQAQTDFFTGTIRPTYETAVRGATDIYNLNAGGVLNAAQNLAGTAGQAGTALGETGESALRTGITGLQSMFDPNYERNQIMAALAPAQSQFQTNVADLRAGFGGTGNLGSARQALAERQLAGQAASQQAATAAQIQKDIAAQRMNAATQLASLGQAGVTGAVDAAGRVVGAAMTPQDFYNKYSSIIFGTPAASYSPDFSGTQGRRTGGTNLGISMPPMPF